MQEVAEWGKVCNSLCFSTAVHVFNREEGREFYLNLPIKKIYDKTLPLKSSKLCRQLHSSVILSVWRRKISSFQLTHWNSFHQTLHPVIPTRFRNKHPMPNRWSCSKRFSVSLQHFDLLHSCAGKSTNETPFARKLQEHYLNTHREAALCSARIPETPERGRNREKNVYKEKERQRGVAARNKETRRFISFRARRYNSSGAQESSVLQRAHGNYSAAAAAAAPASDKNEIYIGPFKYNLHWRAARRPPGKTGGPSFAQLGV